MQQRFQHTTANGKGFIRNQPAIVGIAAWVNVAAFQPFLHGRAIGDQAAQCAANGAAHGLARHITGHIALFYGIADFAHSRKNAGGIGVTARMATNSAPSIP